MERLEAEGLISLEHGQGTFVRERPAVQEVAQAYAAVLLARDRQAALRAAFDVGAGRGVSVPDLYLQVIRPAQQRFGDLWQQGGATVAHEHFATAVSATAVALLHSALPRREPPQRRVLVACVADEADGLGARVAADFLEMAGDDARLLGEDVPTAALAGGPPARHRPLGHAPGAPPHAPARRPCLWRGGGGMSW